MDWNQDCTGIVPRFTQRLHTLITTYIAGLAARWDKCDSKSCSWSLDKLLKYTQDYEFVLEQKVTDYTRLQFRLQGIDYSHITDPSYGLSYRGYLCKAWHFCTCFCFYHVSLWKEMERYHSNLIDDSPFASPLATQDYLSLITNPVM